MKLLAPLAALVLIGCKNDQGFSEVEFDGIAVVTGDFDYVEETLVRLDIGYTPYEGFISAAVYDPEVKPEGFSLKAEQLFLGEVEGTKEIRLYDAVFVNSGTRGLGAYVYNGVETDDSLVADPAVLANVVEYVEKGGTLVVSDWAYDLVEAAWPDKIDFVRDDLVLDDAQAGTSEQVTATVLDEEIKQELGELDHVELQYDFAHWAAIESVASDVSVLLEGDIVYRVSDSAGDGELAGVPLLVSFEAGKGMVLYSTFHWRAQTGAVAEALVLGALEGLQPGTASDSAGGEVAAE